MPGTSPKCGPCSGAESAAAWIGPCASRFHGTFVLVVLLLSLVFTGSPVKAQAIAVAGDRDGLWMLQKGEAGAFVVLYRHILDPPNQLHRLAPLRGRVTDGGLASANDRLWLVYKHNESNPGPAVQMIGVVPVGQTNRRLADLKIQPALPDGVILNALTISQGVPWVLLRVESVLALQKIDATQRLVESDSRPGESSTDSSLDSRTRVERLSQQGLDSTTSPTPGTSQTPHPNPTAGSGAEPPETIPTHRLMWLDRKQWHKAPLPMDWPHDAPCWLVTRGEGDSHPTLVAMPRTPAGVFVWVYQYDRQRWHKKSYPLATDDRTILTSPPGQSDALDGVWVDPRTSTLCTAVADQLILGRAQKTGTRLTLGFSVIRSDSIIPIDTLEMDVAPTDRWFVCPHGQSLSLIVADPQGQMRWTRMNLQGQIVQAPTKLAVSVPQWLSDAPNPYVLVTVLALALLIMFMVWRRDPAWNRLDLPLHLELADLGRRAGAGMIDLLPCLILIFNLFGLPSRDLFYYWPGLKGDTTHMIPGAAAIGLFVTHSLVSELILGKTVGKMVLGLHVTGLTGQKPKAWQIFARNLLKAFDLIALPLLILPAIGPYRQRLGDMVGCTVVVRHTPEGANDGDAT